MDVDMNIIVVCIGVVALGLFGYLCYILFRGDNI